MTESIGGEGVINHEMHETASSSVEHTWIEPSSLSPVLKEELSNQLSKILPGFELRDILGRTGPAQEIGIEDLAIGAAYGDLLQEKGFLSATKSVVDHDLQSGESTAGLIMKPPFQFQDATFSLRDGETPQSVKLFLKSDHASDEAYVQGVNALLKKASQGLNRVGRASLPMPQAKHQ